MVSPWMQHGNILKHIVDMGGPKLAKLRRYVRRSPNGTWLRLTGVLGSSYLKLLKVLGISTHKILSMVTFGV